jgi:hypothetical protein
MKKLQTATKDYPKEKLKTMKEKLLAKGAISKIED